MSALRSQKKEKTKLGPIKSISCQSSRKMSRLTLNVGGVRFETNRGTLTKFPGSTLAKMVASYCLSDPLNKEPLFLDINPEYFRAVLDWLR